MSEKKEKQAPEAEGEELVRVRLFKDSEKYSDDVFVAVNGERCLIQRGKPVEIKAKFAEVLEHSAEQDEQTAELIHKRSEDYRQAEKELN